MAPPGMPKITSTPTASRDRTRLCAPVMPVAGSVALRPAAADTVSTPARAAAASRGAACSLGVVVIWVLLAVLNGWNGYGQQKTPRATGTEGSAHRSWTDALGDYEAAEAGVKELASAGHLHTVRLARRGRQPTRLTMWTSESIFGASSIVGSKASRNAGSSRAPFGRPSSQPWTNRQPMARSACS